ncbi:Transcriptional activator hac1 [Cladobotryum mycophilum]|uniref:Transcriptional activator hac1 n=1 Tax=Cladobotryum mycophilum TaxID=491253 RepID=A0ABR0T4T0_9HYPO
MVFQQSPIIKFEASPAESFLSAPGDNFPSLFAASTPSSTTMNPMEMMTPQSFADDRSESRLSVIPEQSEVSTPDDDDDAPSTEKKPTKKRKSWGQVLPEPKTNLPPRKRAKTEDEKEQRRVERVLRNRRAAQSSRERKRLEVEALEKRNKELENLLINAQKTNLMLVEELNRFRRSSGVVTRSSSPLDSIRERITLSQQLFGPQDGQKNSEHSLVDDFMRSTANPTVNPASLSPPLNPTDSTEPEEQDEDDEEEEEEEPATPEPESREQTPDIPSDLTQHPAEIFADPDAASFGLVTSTQDDGVFSLGDSFSLPASFNADRYVLESELLASPNSSTLDDDYMVGDSSTSFSHQPDFDLFDINDFLNDDANNAANDLMATSDTAPADHGFDLEFTDPETQVSSEYLNQQPQLGASSHGCDAGGIAVVRRMAITVLPSKEVLMTLLWALKVEERRIQRKQSRLLDPERSTPDKPTTNQQLSLFKGASVNKRARPQRLTDGTKRSRLSR